MKSKNTLLILKIICTRYLDYKSEYNIQTVANLVLFPGHSTIVLNKKDNTIKVYGSISAAAKNKGINYSTLYYYINKNKLLKDTYLIIKP